MKFEYKKLENIEKSIFWIGITGIVITIVTIVLFLRKTGINLDGNINTVTFNDFGSFIAGSSGLLFTIATTILVYSEV